MTLRLLPACAGLALSLALSQGCALAAAAAPKNIPPAPGRAAPITASSGGSGGLVPPDGFRAEVKVKERGARTCDPAPKPFTGALKFPSKYEGSDGARDDLNEAAYGKYKEATAPINDLEKNVSSMVGHYVDDGDPATLKCALDWMYAWAQADALEDKTKDHTGKSVRKWALASLASSYVRLKFSPSKPLEAAPEKAIAVERWLDKLGTQVWNDWRDQPLDRTNNHHYWAAWAGMATAVALNRRDLYDWSLSVYRAAARSQADKDGFLPNELARDTRALAYHNYALEPLSMIAAFAKANGDDLAAEGNHALSRIATRVLAGVDDPRMFEARTGKKQVMDDFKEASKFAWLEPYCSVEACDDATLTRLAGLRPLKSYRMGGDVTELFGGG